MPMAEMAVLAPLLAAALVFGLWTLIRQARHKARCSEKTEAVFLGESRESFFGQRTHHYTYTVGGREYTLHNHGKLSTHLFYTEMKPGETRTILYNPGAPQEAWVDYFESFYTSTGVFFLVMGAVCGLALAYTIVTTL